MLTLRTVRDRVFRTRVLKAYDRRCAFTGFQFINGGGRAEVEAAHIKSVEAKGPDVVQNGVALSGTVHWMFDRGLLAVADNSEILLSNHINDVDGVREDFARELPCAISGGRTGQARSCLPALAPRKLLQGRGAELMTKPPLPAQP